MALLILAGTATGDAPPLGDSGTTQRTGPETGWINQPACRGERCRRSQDARPAAAKVSWPAFRLPAGSAENGYANSDSTRLTTVAQNATPGFLQSVMACSANSGGRPVSRQYFHSEAERGHCGGWRTSRWRHERDAGRFPPAIRLASRRKVQSSDASPRTPPRLPALSRTTSTLARCSAGRPERRRSLRSPGTARRVSCVRRSCRHFIRSDAGEGRRSLSGRISRVHR